MPDKFDGIPRETPQHYYYYYYYYYSYYYYNHLMALWILSRTTQVSAWSYSQPGVSMTSSRGLLI